MFRSKNPCDLRYFVPDGKYAFNFVKIGIHPGMGSSFLVKEVAGLHYAQELLFTGKSHQWRRSIQNGTMPWTFFLAKKF
jgi:2-(1,2-epoxy-1,2-dihydrophenyl)acetyl-CoA isomerase